MLNRLHSKSPYALIARGEALPEPIEGPPSAGFFTSSAAAAKTTYQSSAGLAIDQGCLPAGQTGELTDGQQRRLQLSVREHEEIPRDQPDRSLDLRPQQPEQRRGEQRPWRRREEARQGQGLMWYQPSTGLRFKTLQGNFPFLGWGVEQTIIYVPAA